MNNNETRDLEERKRKALIQAVAIMETEGFIIKHVYEPKTSKLVESYQKIKQYFKRR